ncbi:MAG: mannose-1-phosphate guanylyltransferase/mannose-6-phosphate isomerase [Burkholderiales bacterium]|jgi:mannose-1-phosphate guanylyltransferase/mannose-6-phosphate isomerase|nr:mannose-1-phosphate guanylyltransferase/mannose-6-phosphate isomerase [Burkholderiales bacterium]
MSRRMLPKQFLPLVSERSMLQDTILRLSGLATAAPILVSNNEHRFLVAEQLREIGVKPGAQILEPVGRNTAPAVAAAALAAVALDAEAILLVLAADHLIRDVYRFHDAIRAAARLAAAGKLVTFGIAPDHPATGYGYIERGEPVAGHDGAFAVARFVEKPDRANAEAFLASGRFSWNSGMFVFRARRVLDELGRHAPAILAAASASWENATRDLDFHRLDADAFAACPSDSIDYAVMEKTADAAVIPVDIGWSDVGSWSTLWDVSAKDEHGNSVRGDVHLAGTEGSFVRAESRMVSVIGGKDLVVVETDDAVLVTTRDAVQGVKDIVGHLDRAHRSEAVHHKRVYRPWGWYESVSDGDRYQVKRIMVKPGAALSLQMHHHRAEHWVVVSGTAKVTRGEDVMLVSENESTYIPLGTKHRLENPGKVALYLVEVQSGSYLGEDDIVRFEDVYRRG